MSRIAVVGAGVAGLGSALVLAGQGHSVVVLERDATPLPADPDGAFVWERRGAPQVRHSHALLARLRNLLRDDHPAVLADLLAAGATEWRFTDSFPPGIEDRSPQPGDEDLVALGCRRTTFEWVLRRSVLGHPGVEILDGVTVDGLATSPAGGGLARAVGLHLRGGAVVDADLVVAATGPRSPVPAWVADAGGHPVAEEQEDTGIVYLSRFYRLLPDAEEPELGGPIGADLGYLKFAVFKGDNRTFSVTLAAGSQDQALRRALLEPAGFDAAAASLLPVAPWVEPERSAAITGVEVMAGLRNRRRWFVDDGRPALLGFHAVGDAHTCTNPLYGRGCTLAMVHAGLLGDAVAAHGADDEARALAYEAATEEAITPWFAAAVEQDRQSRAAAEATSEDDEAVTPIAILRHGVLPATRTDPVVFRAFIRAFNLLVPPATLMADPDVVGRVLTVFQQRHERPPDPPLGPERDELLALVDAGS